MMSQPIDDALQLIDQHHVELCARLDPDPHMHARTGVTKYVQ
jgi:hypothetical protein